MLAANTSTFTPGGGYSGVATFDDVVTDRSATDTGTIASTVKLVYNAPAANDEVSARRGRWWGAGRGHCNVS